MKKNFFAFLVICSAFFLCSCDLAYVLRKNDVPRVAYTSWEIKNNDFSMCIEFNRVKYSLGNGMTGYSKETLSRYDGGGYLSIGEKTYHIIFKYSSFGSSAYRLYFYEFNAEEGIDFQRIDRAVVVTFGGVEGKQEEFFSCEWKLKKDQLILYDFSSHLPEGFSVDKEIALDQQSVINISTRKYGTIEAMASPLVESTCDDIEVIDFVMAYVVMHEELFSPCGLSDIDVGDGEWHPVSASLFQSYEEIEKFVYYYYDTVAAESILSGPVKYRDNNGTLEVFTPIGAQPNQEEYDWTDYTVTDIFTGKGHDFTVRVCIDGQPQELAFSVVFDDHDCLKFVDSYI